MRGIIQVLPRLTLVHALEYVKCFSLDLNFGKKMNKFDLRTFGCVILPYMLSLAIDILYVIQSFRLQVVGWCLSF